MGFEAFFFPEVAKTTLMIDLSLLYTDLTSCGDHFPSILVLKRKSWAPFWLTLKLMVSQKVSRSTSTSMMMDLSRMIQLYLITMVTLELFKWWTTFMLSPTELPVTKMLWLWWEMTSPTKMPILVSMSLNKSLKWWTKRVTSIIWPLLCLLQELMLMPLKRSKLSGQ